MFRCCLRTGLCGTAPGTRWSYRMIQGQAALGHPPVLHNAHPAHWKASILPRHLGDKTQDQWSETIRLRQQQIKFHVKSGCVEVVVIRTSWNISRVTNATMLTSGMDPSDPCVIHVRNQFFVIVERWQQHLYRFYGVIFLGFIWAERKTISFNILLYLWVFLIFPPIIHILTLVSSLAGCRIALLQGSWTTVTPDWDLQVL